MLVTKFHRCKTITSSPPKLSTALMWSRNMMAEQWALVCCCSVVFALLNLKFHIIVDDYGKSCYYWLCGMQIAGLNSIQDAVLTTSVSQPFSKENQREKKIFSEMKINLIRSWHKYVIPNSRPFVIQLCNYSVFLKGIGNCLKITHCASLGGQQDNCEKIIFQEISVLIYFFVWNPLYPLV